jgi:predicted nuclease of predicted toxin-antitoxin system
MKLFFDQNISYRILKKIGDIFPGSKQVKELKLDNSTDIDIWNYARVKDFVIVTFDSDFIDIATLKGAPPKIIWLRMGNASTDNIASLLRQKSNIIKSFIEDDDSSSLEIF